MIPNTKISHTILEFGKDIILTLPENASKEEFDSSINFIIYAWNAVVIDSWNKTNEMEKTLLIAIEDYPRAIILLIKRLIKRKKTKFKADPRAVGRYWINEKNGEFILGCEARVDYEKLGISGLTK